MSKKVFMFPGQGAQYVGMGKDFYDTYEECRRVYELASQVTGLNIEKLCFEQNEEIHITEYTQIAMLTTEAAIYTALQHAQMKPSACAGLSLGEYGALIASGVMDMKDAFKVVRERGILMQQAVPVGGAMAAVLGLDEAQIEGICARTDGIVSVANYNCPGQIVITGEEVAVGMAGETCKSAGAKRVIKLNVSGPFHSSMLQDAGMKLGDILSEVDVQKIKIPYVTNVTGDYVHSSEEVKDLLQRQVSSSVRWQQGIERLIKDGYDEFVEIGPGHTLAGFMRKIDRSVQVVNIEKVEDFKAYVGK